MSNPPKPGNHDSEALPALPIEADHWRAIVETMRLSPQQARILDLLLRGLCDKQIAARLGIREPTLRTYIARIFARTRAGNRMELAMHILALSHKIKPDGRMSSK